ncbi:MAG: hypothetical protein AAGH82_04445 [Pseudomonadota bacterium]
MWRIINLSLVVFVIVGAAVTFNIKHRAELAEDEVARLQRQIKLERETLDLLKADWAYLNNAQRLQNIVAAFKDELDLVGASTEQLITLDELPDYARRVSVETIADALEDLDGVTTGTIADVIAGQEATQ